MSDKARWQQIERRDWDFIAPVWVEAVTAIPTLGQKPNPGLDKLPELLTLDRESLKRHAGISGMRVQTIWEALYLYSKCDHSKNAAERLAAMGMASWAMFNAYHSAYLGARGILWILGVPVPDLAGRQVFIDLFPGPEDAGRRSGRSNTGALLGDFVVKNLQKLDQRAVWSCLQRVLRISKVAVWDAEWAKELLKFDDSEITPPRNHFLYKAGYWLFDDLEEDLPLGYQWLELSDPVGAEDKSFLLWLCFAVHRLFTSLVQDLSKRSPLVGTFLDAGRRKADANVPEQAAYQEFCAT